MQKLKDLLKGRTDTEIRTHIVVDLRDDGITGWYSAEWLIENYGENEAEIIEYEKEYEEGVIAIRRYLAVYINHLYKCVRDKQGGDWCVGTTLTVQGWEDLALEWCDNDENKEMRLELRRKYDTKKIDYIQEMWGLEIVRVD